MVLAGLVNGEVTARLVAAGTRAVGLSGSDDHLLVATVRDERFGLVGEVTEVNPRPINALLDAGYVAVVAPLAVYVALETHPEAAFAMSLVLLAVALAVLVALRGTWTGR
jgi:acetylglutamate kinase